MDVSFPPDQQAFVRDAIAAETKENLVAKNERQNAAFEESLTRLFANPEYLVRLKRGLAKYVYDFHNRPQT